MKKSKEVYAVEEIRRDKSRMLGSSSRKQDSY